MNPLSPLSPLSLVCVADLQFLRKCDDRKLAICTAYGQVYCVYCVSICAGILHIHLRARLMYARHMGRCGCTTCARNDGQS